MTTRDERDRASEVAAIVRESARFTEAVDAYNQLFRSEECWGVKVAAPMWEANDLRLIRETLSGWFH
jgi:hypothetical protein